MSKPPNKDYSGAGRRHLAPTAVIGAVIGAIIAVALLSSGPPEVQAQQTPPHVFIGSANIDNAPVPDGTVIIAYIDGEGVSKALIANGKFTLLVEQPDGQSISGKIVYFTINGNEAKESYHWEIGGADELNLHATSGASPAGSLQDALECVARVLGRMPMGPQDMSDQERMKVFEACPAVRDNISQLGGSLQQGQPGLAQPGQAQLAQMEQELREIVEEIHRLERESNREIQQELNLLDRKRQQTEQQLWDDLQRELDLLDQKRFETERQMHQDQQSADFRRQAQIEVKYRGILDTLERERFETERRAQSQIQQEISRMDRQRSDQERQFWDAMQREINRLEQRRFELENAIERERFAFEQQQREEGDRRRFERERRMEEQRFKQQGELERQRIEQDRQRFEQERKLDEERFRQQEQMDRDRLEQERQRLQQERRLDQERFDRESKIQTGLPGTSINLTDPSGPLRIQQRLPTRGFFSNSSTGEVSDLENFMDPTSLAILGILLTLVATSLSLVKGS